MPSGHTDDEPRPRRSSTAAAREAKLGEDAGPGRADLLRETLLTQWPGAAAALAGVPATASAADRVAAATEALLGFSLANETAVRTVLGLTLLQSVQGEASREHGRALRPEHRFGLIDEALRPFVKCIRPERLQLLRLALAAVIGPETVVALKDHCDRSDAEVVEVAAWLARAAVEAALAANCK